MASGGMGKNELSATYSLLALGMAIAPLPGGFDPVTLGVIVAAVALTVYSGAEYLFTGRHRVREA